MTGDGKHFLIHKIYEIERRKNDMKILKVRITTFEPMLGSAPANPEIYKEFIASKAPDAPGVEDEIAAIGADAVAEKGTTVFPRDKDGNPILFDYHIKGMFKDACQMLRYEKSDNESCKLKAYKKLIDGLIFPFPRQIPIQYDGDITICQRPLRAQTLQGERVALASSEQISAGAVIELGVLCKNDNLIPAVREWLDYGILRGLGQWRNSGMGRFTWEEISCENATPADIATAFRRAV